MIKIQRLNDFCVKMLSILKICFNHKFLKTNSLVDKISFCEETVFNGHQHFSWWSSAHWDDDNGDGDGNDDDGDDDDDDDDDNDDDANKSSGCVASWPG